MPDRKVIYTRLGIWRYVAQRVGTSHIQGIRHYQGWKVQIGQELVHLLTDNSREMQSWLVIGSCISYI